MTFLIMTLAAVWEQIKHPWWSSTRCVDAVELRRVYRMMPPKKERTKCD
jgi:hypothetical protein